MKERKASYEYLGGEKPNEWNGVRVTYAHDGSSLEFRLDELPADIVEGLKAFGLRAMLSDAASAVKGDDAKDAMLRRYETLKSGKWAARRGGGAVDVDRMAWLEAAAIVSARNRGDSLEVARERVRELAKRRGWLARAKQNREVEKEYQKVFKDLVKKYGEVSTEDLGL